LYNPDLDPMTLILKLDLGIMKTHLQTGNEFAGQGIQKLEPEQDRQTVTTKTLPRRIRE